MALRGNLRDFSLTQLLNLVNLAKKTGTLTIQDLEHITNLYFREGKLVHASNGKGLGLLDLLQKAGRLSAEQSQTIRERFHASSEKELGLLLINAGYTNREQILETLRGHFLEAVYRLFTRSEGVFVFEPNRLPPEGKITLALRLEDIILEGSRLVRERRRLEEAVPDLDLIPQFAPHARAALKRVQLSPEEWRVLSQIQGQRSLQEIARASALNDPQIRKVVYGLLAAGLVQLVPPLVPRVVTPPPFTQPAVPVKRSLILRLIERVRGI
ncbi:MAG: DUF4388 domain-containing protein [Chloroflexi bacterium]|nr:DUF4388 domain-containing protein [Chloroflexota bacterium]